MTACSQDEKRSTVKDLLTAAADNDTAAIKSLVQANARLEQRDNKKRTPLMVAVYHHHPEAAALLIAAGADVNAQDDMQNSPFLYAGAEGYVDILQLCLQAGAKFDVFNRYGGSALIPACERGHVEVVKTLLAVKDFPIDHVNRLGWTGLLEAIILSNGGPKHIQIVQLLVDAGANVNLADGDGVSPLAHARSKGFTEIVSILEKAGAK